MKKRYGSRRTWRRSTVSPGNLARAEALYRDVVTRSHRVFTHGEWDLGYFAGLLGELLAQQGKTEEARPVLTESVAVLGKNLGAESPRTQRVAKDLAALK
ncbi:MAG: tetratricopeptide repeat protein [Rhodospirillales bacterium]